MPIPGIIAILLGFVALNQMKKTPHSTGRGLARPRCDVPEVPMEGYWASARRQLLESESDNHPQLAAALGRDGVVECQAVFDACYPPRTASPSGSS